MTVVKRLLACLFVASFWSLNSEPAKAQVLSDNTLSTSVIPLGGGSFLVQAGNQRGENLFHSFQEFSIPTGGAAIFNNGADIETIFGRVTGGNASDIDGLINTQGTASLFLLNPAGIIFGPNARLAVGGSFLGTTAESIEFADDITFSGYAQDSPLLSVSRPVGLNVGAAIAPISVATQPQFFLDPGLTVGANESLTLVGGNIALDSGRVGGLGGRVELVALAEAGYVDLSEQLQVNIPAEMARADVVLTNDAQIFASAFAPINSLKIQARNLTIQDSNVLVGPNPLLSSRHQVGDASFEVTDQISLDNSQVFTGILFPTITGEVSAFNIDTSSLLVKNSARIGSFTAGQGSAGIVNIATDEIIVDGTGSDLLSGTASGIYSVIEEGGVGNGGQININTQTLSLINGGVVSTSVYGRGSGGDINIVATESVRVEGITPGPVGIASVIGSTVEDFGIGDGGDITLTAPLLYLAEAGVISGRTRSQGNAGNVTLTVDNAELLSGGQVSTTTQSNGDAGELIVNVRDRILISGSDSTFEQRQAIIGDFVDFGNPESGLYVNTKPSSTGSGGNLQLTASHLLVEAGGQINSVTEGTGNAGQVKIEADSIEIRGIDQHVRNNGQVPSRISASSLSDAAAGAVTLQSSELLLADGGVIAVNGAGQGGAGNLEISSDRVTLSNYARLTAEVAGGRQGNISLNVTETLVLKHNSQITTTATGAASGGNIRLEVPFILGYGNSDIVARAEQGQGGNIDIHALGLFGIAPRANLTPQSDINASSQFGLDGTVEIQGFILDPHSGLVQLPTGLADASSQVVAGCSAIGESSLIASGRGGVPLSPTSLVESYRPWVDMRDLSALSSSSENDSPTLALDQAQTTGHTLTEATNWTVNSQGQIRLLTAEEISQPNFAASCIGNRPA